MCKLTSVRRNKTFRVSTSIYRVQETHLYILKALKVFPMKSGHSGVRKIKVFKLKMRSKSESSDDISKA